MKEYVKPELELISLIAEEEVTGDLMSGKIGMEDLPEGW